MPEWKFCGVAECMSSLAPAFRRVSPIDGDSAALKLVVGASLSGSVDSISVRWPRRFPVVCRPSGPSPLVRLNVDGWLIFFRR